VTESLLFVVNDDGDLELAAESPGEEITEAETEALDEGPANPILPTSNELFWGAVFFFLLWALMKFVLVPPVDKTMAKRADAIRADEDAADQAAAEVARLRADYEATMASAHAEATRILEDARHAADGRRAELVRQAEAEINQAREQAQAEVEAAKAAAFEQLKGQVATLAVDAAERVVQRGIDRPALLPLAEQYVAEVGSRN
jgi:F-type H+-transporting ATPase subunit b